MSGPYVTLAEFAKRTSEVPDEVRSEAESLGYRVWSPGAAHAEILGEFLDRYQRDLSPGGVLFLSGAPSHRGSETTGIPLTDAPHAREVLGIDAADGDVDVAAARFWSVLRDVQRATGGDWNRFFSTAALFEACPYSFARLDSDASGPLARALPAMFPRAYDASLGELDRVLRGIRPSVVVCLGELAFVAVADLARNRQELLALTGARYQDLVLSQTWGNAKAKFPTADLAGFRAKLVPLGELRSMLYPHAAVSIAGLAADCWN
jgi:hypothetical protein